MNLKNDESQAESFDELSIELRELVVEAVDDWFSFGDGFECEDLIERTNAIRSRMERALLPEPIVGDEASDRTDGESPRSTDDESPMHSPGTSPPEAKELSSDDIQTLLSSHAPEPVETAFASEVDEAPSEVVVAYERLCPGAFDDGDDDDDGDDLVDEPSATAPAKRRRKGSSNLSRKKRGRKDKYVPVPPESRNRKTARPRKRAMPAYDRSKWVHFDPQRMPQHKMRDMISVFYLSVLKAPPPEDWDGEGGAVSEICAALNMNRAQRQRVKNVIAATHSSLNRYSWAPLDRQLTSIN